MTNTLELSSKPETGLAVIPQVNVDQLDTAKPLAEIFQPYQTTLEKWEAKAKSLVVSDLSQKAEMQMARVARLELKEARVEMDKTRKGLVENLKARTGKIDGTARIIREKIESLEALLLESEQFAERYAAKVKAELKAKREDVLKPLVNPPIFLADLSDFSEVEFQQMVANANLLIQAKADAAAKSEADRKAKEEADRAERERIAAENARLKLEAEATAKRLEEERKEREAQAAKEHAEQEAERKRIEAERQAEREKAESERKAIEAKARKERSEMLAASIEKERKAREETDRLNAELQVERNAKIAEASRIESDRAAKEKEAKRAAAAPDKVKLTSYSEAVQSLTIPELSNALLRGQLISRRSEFIAWVENQIDAELL